MAHPLIYWSRIENQTIPKDNFSHLQAFPVSLPLSLIPKNINPANWKPTKIFLRAGASNILKPRESLR